MASISNKILGQALPNGSSVDLYTVGSGKEAVISTLHVTNVTGSASNFTIWVRKAGASATDAMKLAHSVPLTANQFLPITVGITLSETDVVTVSSSVSSSISFNLFGAEITL